MGSEKELEPCPFCGLPPRSKMIDQRTFVWCERCAHSQQAHIWNIRPTEDALRARLAESEQELAECKRRGPRCACAVKGRKP